MDSSTLLTAFDDEIEFKIICSCIFACHCCLLICWILLNQLKPTISRDEHIGDFSLFYNLKILCTNSSGNDIASFILLTCEQHAKFFYPWVLLGNSSSSQSINILLRQTSCLCSFIEDLTVSPSSTMIYIYIYIYIYRWNKWIWHIISIKYNTKIEL